MEVTIIYKHRGFKAVVLESLITVYDENDGIRSNDPKQLKFVSLNEFVALGKFLTKVVNLERVRLNWEKPPGERDTSEDKTKS